MYNCTPHFFIYHTPTREIKLAATKSPNSAGYQSPNRFINGEKTPGKEPVIHTYPRIHTTVRAIGRFFAVAIVFSI